MPAILASAASTFALTELVLVTPALSCVCIDDVASTYPNSVDVTEANVAILPLPSDTRALEAVKSEVTTVDIAPAILATLLASIPAANTVFAAIFASAALIWV